MPVTDAQILAAICDITLLLVRAEKTTKKMSQLARDGLLSTGARILGVVVNDVSKKELYGYYSSYNHYYKYSSRSKKKRTRDKKVSGAKKRSDSLTRPNESK